VGLVAEGFLPPVVAILGAQISEYLGEMGIARGEQRKLQAEAARTSSIGKKAMLGLAGATLLVGIAATKMASQFDAQMELIHTQAGASQQEVDQLKQKTLALAPAVGVGPDQLAAGLYHVESAGFRGAQALDMVAESAKGARIGQADLEATTQAMIGVMAVGFKDVHSASDAMAFLNTTVGIGDMRMEKLAQSIATGTLPAFKSAQLGMIDYSAALATLTDNVTPADEAATRLRMTVSLMANVQGPAAAALSEIGLSSTALANDMRKPDGLLAAVMDLKTHLEQSGKTAVEQNVIIDRAFGGGRTSGAIHTLLEETDRLKDKYHEIGDQAQRAAKFNEAWTATNQTLAQQGAEVRAWLQATAIELGERLIPYVQKALGEAIDFARALGQSLGPALRDIGNDVRPLAVLVGAVLVDAFRALDAVMHVLGQHRAEVEGLAVGVLAFVAATRLVAVGTAVYRSIGSLLTTVRLKAMYAADGVRALATAENSAKVASLGLQAILGIVSIAVGVLAAKHANAQQAAEEHQAAVQSLSEALKQNNGTIDANVRAQIVQQEEQSGVLKTMGDLGVSAKTYTDAMMGNKAAQDAVRQAMQTGIESGKISIFQAGQLADTVGSQSTMLGDATAAYQRQTTAMGGDAAATQHVTSTTQAATTALDKMITAGRTLSDILDTLAGKNLDAMSASLAFKDSIGTLGTTLDQDTPKQRAQARALDEGTQAGRTFKEQIIAAANAAIAHGKAVEASAANTHDQATATRMGAAATETDIKALQAWATQHHINQQALQAIIGTLGTFADKAKTSGKTAGEALGEGFAQGIDSTGARVAGSVAELAGKARILRQQLAIESPSKVTTYWGRMFGEGFATGIESMYGRIGQVVRTLGSRATLETTTRATLAKLASVAKNTGSGRADVAYQQFAAANSRLLAEASRRDSIVARLKAAQQRLSDLLSAKAQYGSQVLGQVRQYGAVTGATPASGYTDITTADVINNLRQKAADARTFNNQLTQLRKLGLNTESMDEIVQAGVDQGGQIAAALVAGGTSAVKQVNLLESQVYGAAHSIAATSSAAMYDAGIHAAQGLVRGLQTQEKALNAMMARLGASMVAQLKKTLGIRSPSSVMADQVGRWIPAGVAAGVDRHAHLARRSVAGLLNPSTAAPRWLDAGTSMAAGGGTVVNNHYHIAGTVLAERQLMDLVRSQTQGYARNNISTGLVAVRQ
jgi:Phage-related minor tail protein